MIQNTGSPFGPLITAVATPFEENFSLDAISFGKIIDHLLATGSTAIVVNGTTGESPTIEEQEMKLLLRFSKDKTNHKAKLIAGIGTNSTTKSVSNAQIAEECGADGLLAVVPYYNKPTQAGLIKHFQEISKNTSLPIILYNIPGRTGINMSVETTLEIVESCKNVVGLKDSTGNTEQAAEISAKVKSNNFWIYSGDDSLTLPYLSIGAAGVISVASHLIGLQIKAMIQSHFKGDHDQARKIHYECLPLFKGLFTAPNPTCLKYALSKIGLCQNILRLPLVPLSADEQKKLDAILSQSPINMPEVALSK